MEPVLQVALDHMHLKRALLAAKEAVDGGADWLEAGTPLVKSEGIEVVRQLKKSFPGKTIVADLKTMDTGAFEVEIAAKAGPAVIAGGSDPADESLLGPCRAPRRYGSKIMVDLMRVANNPPRAKELEKLGGDYLNMHVSIDEQMIAHTPLQELKAVAAATSLPVAVAGGLNSETVGQALKAGASIVIVGGAIIKAEDVAGATRTIKKAILQRKSIPTGLYKKYADADVGEAFRKVSTPNLADAMQKRGVMTGLVPRIKHGTKLVGRAVTVKTADGDWAKPVEAIDRARAGDVIVIDVGGGPTAVWGELASNSCLVKGVAGVVIDGAVRDLDTILELNFPCFSRHVAPHAGEPKGLGEIGSEIECGGQKVHSGDWIGGDESGLIVVAGGGAVAVCDRAALRPRRGNPLPAGGKTPATPSPHNTRRRQGAPPHRGGHRLAGGAPRRGGAAPLPGGRRPGPGTPGGGGGRAPGGGGGAATGPASTTSGWRACTGSSTSGISCA